MILITETEATYQEYVTAENSNWLDWEMLGLAFAMENDLEKSDKCAERARQLLERNDQNR